jgi:hypothetical protein
MPLRGWTRERSTPRTMRPLLSGFEGAIHLSRPAAWWTPACVGGCEVVLFLPLMLQSCWRSEIPVERGFRKKYSRGRLTGLIPSGAIQGYRGGNVRAGAISAGEEARQPSPGELDRRAQGDRYDCVKTRGSGRVLQRGVGCSGVSLSISCPGNWERYTITHDAKRAGKRSVGNTLALYDRAGAGDMSTAILHGHAAANGRPSQGEPQGYRASP